MQIGSAFGRALIVTLFYALDFIQWFIFIWVILSWIVFFASNSSMRWRHRGVYGVLTQINDFFSRGAAPILRPFRRLLPAYKTGGIDFSPILLLLAIVFLRTFLGYAAGPILYGAR
jgi:YggT family protein